MDSGIVYGMSLTFDMEENAPFIALENDRPTLRAVIESYVIWWAMVLFYAGIIVGIIYLLWTG